ncbi:hypothetical protein [Marinomonas polaris]|nr:hypothetical protein [Marinomonas polaris]
MKKSRGISRRIDSCRIDEGYCLICGEFSRLTEDHVPPKGAIVLTAVEQKLVTEIYGSNLDPSLKGVKGKRGSTFKTICSNCNNYHLGKNDNEVARLFKDLNHKLLHHIKSANSYSNILSIEVDALKFCRAMVGHVLAATSSKECLKKPLPSPHFDSLRRFVLGDDNAISETHDLYYWYYPFRRHFSARLVGFHNKGHNASLSCLNFFPLAFLITPKNEGIFPVQAKRLELHDKRMYIEVSARNIGFAQFPFCALDGNVFMVLNDDQCITSYPSAKVNL